MGEKVDLHIGGYYLTENIGTGGMGSVFRAVVEDEGRPLPVGSPVAVKLLHPHLRTIDEFVKRFHREARLAAMLDHENVVRVIDEGVQDERHHYIVMELAEGLRLTDMISDGVPLSPQQTIEIMGQISDALNAAANIDDPENPGRTRSLVHRDIKPENIIIQPQDRAQYETMTNTGDKTVLANIRVKLLDFGLARDTRALSTILSQTGQSLGTPAYMSPEQCTGGTVDTRSDIYSIGVVAYHMITGTMPFAGPTTVAYASQHAEEIPPDILKRNPLCPKNLADCIYRCLAKSPSDRYAGPAELKDDLGRVAAGQAVIKIHKFRKKRAISKRKLGGIFAAAILVAAGVIFGAQYFLNDSARSNMASAIQQAQVATASGDYAGAGQILQEAIDSVANRSDRVELTAAASAMLTDIAARAAEQNATNAVADVSSLIAGGDFSQAVSVAKDALAHYSQTESARQLTDLLAQARQQQKIRADKVAADQAAAAQLEAAAAAARGKRFRQYRDEGDAAFNNEDFRAAIVSYEKALAEKSDASIRSRLELCREKTTPQRIAVADFKISGDVRTHEAGQSVAEILLTRFRSDRYQLVERSHLAAILEEHDLAMSQIVENSALLRNKKLSGVRYLVLGTISKFGKLVISARLVDVTTGDIVQSADVSAEDDRGLLSALGELAKILQMTDGEKAAYLDEQLYPQLLSQARAKVASKDYEASIALYRRCLSIKSTLAVEDELTSVQKDKQAWEKLQAAERQRRAQIVAAEREKRASFDSLIDKAGSCFNKLPQSPPDELTNAQKNILNNAISDINEALKLYPSDVQAINIKNRIQKYLDVTKYLKLSLGNGVEMKLVKIPAGSFLMGSPSSEEGREENEGPQRRVTISKPFYMGIYEVTQEQYEAVMGVNPSPFKESGKQAPIDNISWYDAATFCKKLSHQIGRTVVLPTEAQWEYACRANTASVFSFGNTDSDLDLHGWHGANSSDHPSPVGQKLANSWGLYDMHGNVWEWCSDWYEGGYYAKADTVDPKGPQSGDSRVIRGGAYDSGFVSCRSACRSCMRPHTCSVQVGLFVGFRVVVYLGGDNDTVDVSDNKSLRSGESASVMKEDAKPEQFDFQKKELTLDLGDGVELKLVKIPAGSFLMGRPEGDSVKISWEFPQHRVIISAPFYMGIHEVTCGQFERFISDQGYRTDAEAIGWSYVWDGTRWYKKDGASWRKPGFKQDDCHPVVCVSYDDAVEFCKWLSMRTGRKVILPMEAQWEYSCRANTLTKFYFGDDDSRSKDYAWCQGSSQTHPVGRKKPNAFGLYDMHGNVWEWCQDWFSKNYYSESPVKDPAGPDTGEYRVLRGGSWYYQPWQCRSCSREARSPDMSSSQSGFRVVVLAGKVAG